MMGQVNPNMLTAENWTASKRLLLLELAPDGDRNAIHVRFVIGQGNPAVRKKIYGDLDSVGLKSKRTKITDTWTRLATDTLASKLDRSGRLLQWCFNTSTLAHQCRRGASTPSAMSPGAV